MGLWHLLLLLWHTLTAAFLFPHHDGSISRKRPCIYSSIIDFQRDESRFGRGEFHLSASLEEGDVVVYQTGSWKVDGVQVGYDEASYEYALVDNIQVVFTHNCEHGVVRGLGLDFDGKTFTPSDEYIEFGPEQLIARIPVRWVGEQQVAEPTDEIDEDLWLADDSD